MTNNDDILTQSGFQFSWESSSPESTSKSDGFFGMRGWQKDAFQELKDDRFMILNAPMGSGKSWLMCFLSAYKMKQNRTLKTIIAVPQVIIAPGFAEAKLEMPDGERICWSIHHNLCTPGTKGAVKHLINWLKGSSSHLSERSLICTHQTLVKAYQKLKETGQLELLDNLLLWIDEAHHVKNVEMKDIEGAVISNEIGELVKSFFTNSNPNLLLGLTTASFFRGDRCSLLTTKMEEQCARFNLAYDEYLASMKHLKSFSFDFLICGYDYSKSIEILAKKNRSRDIIHIPHPTSRHTTGNKYQEVTNIIEKYQNIHGGTIEDLENGVTILKNEVGQFKILDLVDEDRRIEKKAFINSPDLKEDKSSLDAIIALGMFKEGANWIWADRSIIVGTRSSLVDIIQMIGRLFRDAEGKEHVEVFQLLPFSLDQKDSDKFKDNLNNYLKAIYASLILEDILNPIKIKTPRNKDKDVDTSQKDKGFSKRQNLLTTYLPEESKQLSLIEDVSSLLMKIAARKENSTEPTSLYDSYQKLIPNILNKYEIDSHHDEIGKQIWGMFARQTLRMQGVNVEYIDFEILKATHPLEGLLRFTSGSCNINTFQALREAISCDNPKNEWWYVYNLLNSYLKKNKTQRLPEQLTIDDINVSSWASVQRRSYKYGKLSDERKQALEKLPNWFWDYTDSRNEKGKEALMVFLNRERHLRVPTTHQENSFPLGKWAAEKRDLFSKNELDDEEIRFFESFSEWSWKDINDQVWDYSYLMLKKFVQINGHAQPASISKIEGFPVATWVKTQRDTYVKGRLSKEKAELLEVLPGWSWQVFEDRKKQGFEALDSFVKREGHALVPTDHIENSFKLGRWVAIKRLAATNPKSKHRITEEDKRKLESYPGWHWDGMEGRWERGKKFLLQFVAREEHSRVIDSHLEDRFELGRWVGIWRYEYNKKKLPQWKIDFFESLPQWSWDVKTDKWFEGLAVLKEYVKREGHASVPAKHKEGTFTLGVWVRTQKYSYTAQTYGKKLSQEKIILLEAVPGWSWDNELDKSWETGFQCLKKFNEIYGHVKVPARYVLDDYNLGIWLSGQKNAFKKGSLSTERVQQLEQFPDWANDPKKDKWQKAYDLLLKFYQREGHAKVKFDHVEDGFNLGEWVQTQRKAFKADKIAKERIELLESLSDWSWNTRSENTNLINT
jgi:superfamily II DNA or RNA helicase